MARHERLTQAHPRGRPAEPTARAALRGSAADEVRTPASRFSSPRPSAAARPDASPGRYVYGIVETRHRLDVGPIGIGSGRNPVYSIHSGDLAAVVSDTPLTLYDATRENLLAHELVNQTVLRSHTIIPMAFGTIFRNEEDVVELLRSAGKAFGDVLAQVRGKFEVGVKAVWHRERVLELIESEHPEIRDLKREITETRAGSTYFARLRLARLVEAALEERADRYALRIWETLRSRSTASRPLRPIGDSMILHGAFLVDREGESAFDEALSHLRATYGDVLSLECTGPWPPYNFVNIKLRLERAN